MNMETNEKRDNIVKEANDEILDNTACPGQKEDRVTDCQVEKENVLLGPDPNSLDSRG